MSKQTLFRVSNMKCNGCVASATKAVCALPGVVSATFDLQAGTGLVTGEADPQAVVEALRAAGYPAAPAEGSS
jgi:Cu+-exporting ATPase